MASSEEVKAKRKAGLEKARLMKAAKKKEKEAAVRNVASIDGVGPDAVVALMEEIRDLRGQLEAAKKERSVGENEALATAQAQAMALHRSVDPVPTGKTVMMPKLKEYKTVGYHDDGRPILKPVFERKPVPLYFYKIDMPPCGGVDLKINGDSYYHGAVYEFDEDTLRCVQDMVHRLWKHDADIHGSDENFYRKQARPTLSAR